MDYRERISFAKNSLKKYDEYNGFKYDPYIGFFSLWIGLNAIYAYRQDIKTAERKKIKKLFDESRALETIDKEAMIKLIHIIEDADEHPILSDYFDSNLKDLKNFYKGRGYYVGDLLNEQLGSLLAKIRNNLFHGLKGWNKEGELRLVKAANTVLYQVLRYFVSKGEKVLENSLF